MPYCRVIPRDLFNESKLLKCLGQLALLIHDGVPWPLELKHEFPKRGFLIDQDESSGALFCRNLYFSLMGQQIKVRSAYNSRSPYPLHFEDKDGGEWCVFNDDGLFSADFVVWAETVVKGK